MPQLCQGEFKTVIPNVLLDTDLLINIHTYFSFQCSGVWVVKGLLKNYVAFSCFRPPRKTKKPAITSRNITNRKKKKGMKMLRVHFDDITHRPSY